MVWNQYRDVRLQANLKINRWIEGHETWARMGAAVTLALLMGGLAQVKLFTPLTPVPFTLQVLGASLMGGLLGARWGAASAGIYVALGMVGLPVFAGQLEDFQRFEWFSGMAVFATSLSGWYLAGFVAQAFIVGTFVDRREQFPHRSLNVLAPAALTALLAFAFIHMYFLFDYDALYRVTDGSFRNAWFALLVAGLVVLSAAAAWLSLTTKARRERVELFFANILGLIVLYGIGMVGFAFVWAALGYPALSLSAWLAYTVVPFIPIDVAKILVAVALLTMLRPTRRELEAAQAGPKGSSPAPVSAGVAADDV